MEDSKDKQILASEKEPDGLSLVVERSQILEESHVREVGGTILNSFRIMHISHTFPLWVYLYSFATFIMKFFVKTSFLGQKQFEKASFP